MSDTRPLDRAKAIPLLDKLSQDSRAKPETRAKAKRAAHLLRKAEERRRGNEQLGHTTQYGEIELSRAHQLEKEILEKWNAEDEADYFQQHPIARAKRSMGFKVVAPPSNRSMTIFEARRGGHLLFHARASGEVSGGHYVKNRHFEFDRLVSTQREPYDLSFPDDSTSRLLSENALATVKPTMTANPIPKKIE